METGWKTVLGNAEEGGLFLKKLKLPLKISERAWWLKVSLLSKHKSGVKGSGPAPMDLSTMNTGNTVKSDTETKQTKRNTVVVVVQLQQLSLRMLWLRTW